MGRNVTSSSSRKLSFLTSGNDALLMLTVGCMELLALSVTSNSRRLILLFWRRGRLRHCAAEAAEPAFMLASSLLNHRDLLSPVRSESFKEAIADSADAFFFLRPRRLRSCRQFTDQSPMDWSMEDTDDIS